MCVLNKARRAGYARGHDVAESMAHLLHYAKMSYPVMTLRTLIQGMRLRSFESGLGFIVRGDYARVTGLEPPPC